MKHLKQKLKLFSFICLLSIVFISESVGAKSTFKLSQVSQQQNTQVGATRAEAERLMQEGFKLFQQGTEESLRQAIIKNEQALKLWEQLGDKSKQAWALVGIGKINDLFGKKQKALEYYNQALLMLHEEGDKCDLNHIMAKRSRYALKVTRTIYASIL